MLKIIITCLVGLTMFSSTQAIVTCTVYNAVPAQTNSDPSHTASMFKLDLRNPYKHKIIAVSRDLLKEFPMGTKVKIEGTSYDGIYVVEDKMNKRYKKRIDILINTNMRIGKWTKVKMTKI
jgi:3D (Asp-Asp-Asp) domain-containing protein